MRPSASDVDQRLSELVERAYHPVAMSTLELAGSAGRTLLDVLLETHSTSTQMDNEELGTGEREQ